MNNKEIRELSDKELIETLKDKRMFFTRLKLNHKVSDIENPMLVRTTRREIARIKTELNVRKRNNSVAK